MFTDVTGRNGLAHCRGDYSDYAAFGFGLIARDTWSGCLDAPDYMPQGSIRIRNTVRSCPSLSLANRDAIAGFANLGVGHDGQEAAT